MKANTLLQAFKRHSRESELGRLTSPSHDSLLSKIGSYGFPFKSIRTAPQADLLQLLKGIVSPNASIFPLALIRRNQWQIHQCIRKRIMIVSVTLGGPD